MAEALDNTQPSENELLHAGGRASGWGNLGLWPAPDYAGAAEALALAVGRAAALRPGARVLSLACGAGEELALWRRAFGAAAMLGVERAPSAQAVPAAAAVPGIEWRCGDALAVLEALAAQPPAFDAVLCVDAAYHFAPREHLLRAARACLAPGGGIAFTDLVAARRGVADRLAVRAAAWASGIAGSAIVDDAAARQRLAACGFADVRLERLDEAVLGGFSAFVQAQTRRLGALAQGPGWRRARTLGRWWPRLGAAGLGYALISARAG